MEEEKKEKPETKAEANIRRASEAAERQEKANEKHEELVVRQEALAVEKVLGGKADAGDESKPEKKEETPKEYAEKVMSGEAND